MLADDIQPYLDQVVRREITNRALAAQLKVSEAHLCRVLKRLKVKREAPPDRAAQAQLNAARREFRLKVAREMSIAQAAAAAGCSTRTIYRLKKKAAA